MDLLNLVVVLVSDSRKSVGISQSGIVLVYPTDLNYRPNLYLYKGTYE